MSNTVQRADHSAKNKADRCPYPHGDYSLVAGDRKTTTNNLWYIKECDFKWRNVSRRDRKSEVEGSNFKLELEVKEGLNGKLTFEQRLKVWRVSYGISEGRACAKVPRQEFKQHVLEIYTSPCHWSEQSEGDRSWRWSQRAPVVLLVGTWRLFGKDISIYSEKGYKVFSNIMHSRHFTNTCVSLLWKVTKITFLIVID